MTIDSLLREFIEPAMSFYKTTGIKPQVVVKLPADVFKPLWLEYVSRAVWMPGWSHACIPTSFRIHDMLTVESVS
jgi:hypothetical protein